MVNPEHFEQIGNRGFFRPTGECTFEAAMDLAMQAMVAARERGCADLLVNVTSLAGTSPPSVFARYECAVKWAQSAGNILRVALVVPAALIDPQKIGVLMAQNRGVTGDVFTTEVAAIRWLDAQSRTTTDIAATLRTPNNSATIP